MSLLSQDTAGLTFVEACDAAMGRHDAPETPPGLFPLWRRIHLRSDLNPGFQSQEFTAGADGGESSPGELVVGFLTLAGWDGYLPEEVAQEIQWDTLGEGVAYHAFLDVLNRRFWELQYLLQRMSRDLAAPMSADDTGWIDTLPALCGTAADAGDDVPWLQAFFSMEGGGLPQPLLNELLSLGHGAEVRVRSHGLTPVPLAGHARMAIGDRLGVHHASTKCLGAQSSLPVRLDVLVLEPPLDDERGTLALAAAVNRAVGSSSCTASYRFARAYVEAQAWIGDANCRLGQGATLRASAPFHHLLSRPETARAPAPPGLLQRSLQTLDFA